MLLTEKPRSHSKYSVAGATQPWASNESVAGTERKKFFALFGCYKKTSMLPLLNFIATAKAIIKGFHYYVSNQTLWESYFNSLLPTPVSSILHFDSEYHDYVTRSRFNLHKTCHKYQFAITWQAPIIWNDIPLTVRNNLTVSNFKKNLRLYFSE